jgi:dynactin complex subunit
MNYDKLTKVDALKLCQSLWSWLERNPSKGKKDWPGWIKIGREFDLRCPCCEYKAQQFMMSCRQCILNGFAWNESCMEGGSLYINWSHTTDNIIRQRNAHLMVLACRRAIYKETK